MNHLKKTPEGVIIAIKVTPKSHKNEIIGWENHEIKIRIRAIPEKGHANNEVIHFLAKLLNISLSSLTLVSGTTSRHKKILIKGFDLTKIEEILLPFLLE